MRADQVIIEPVLSEKSNIARDGNVKKYTFRVNPKANKYEIVAAVKELFGVEAVACNTMNVKGKPKATRGRGGAVIGTKPNWKKAVVTLKAGDVISALESV